MLLVLAYWIYLFIVTAIFGVLLGRTLNVQRAHPAILLVFGGFILALFSSVWALFAGLNFNFDYIILGSSLFFGGFLRKDMKVFLMDFVRRIQAMPSFLKILLGILIVLAAAKSSGAPFILDNESYYIQTMKWLDNYGLVKGLANIHPFLAQTSGWHILQSALNLNQWIDNINDINGFYLCVAIFYAIDHLRDYYQTKKPYLLLIGAFILFNVFLFQFIDAPSPDLAIYVCTYFIFSEFLKETVYPSEANQTFIQIFCIALFAIFIKVTAILLLVFPVLIFFRRKTTSLKDMLKVGGLGITTLLLFLCKNYVVSGYPLYPLELFGNPKTIWKLPSALHHFITYNTKLYGYFMTDEQFQNSSVWTRFVHWLSLPALHGIFNKAMTVLLLIFPVVVWKSPYKKSFATLFMVAALQMLLLWFGSPQYRFFMAFFMLLLLSIFAVIIKNRGVINAIIVTSVIAVAVPLLFPLPLSELTENRFQSALGPFSYKNLVYPHPNTRYIDTEYAKILEGNLTFYSPINIDFFWATGDGPLPCIQAGQIDYLKLNYNTIPQQIGKDISEGFHAIILSDE